MAVRAGTVVYRILGYLTNTPPGSPAEGDAYIVGSAPTGAWVGHSGECAVFALGRWWYQAVANNLGALFFDAGGGKQYAHSASAPVELAAAVDLDRSIMTTQGDLVARNATVPARVATGANEGEVVIFDAAEATKCKFGTPNVGNVISFMTATATAANARTVGMHGTSSIQGGCIVTAGKTAKFLSVIANVETGTTDGTYTVDVVVRDEDTPADVILATMTGVVAGGVAVVMRTNLCATIASPLGSLAAGKRFRIGVFNRASSPGALSAINKTFFVRYVEI